jgi:hypothetical protein
VLLPLPGDDSGPGRHPIQADARLEEDASQPPNQNCADDNNSTCFYVVSRTRSRRGTSMAEIDAEFRKKSLILIDESLGIEVAVYLREKGYNALFVGEVGLVIVLDFAVGLEPRTATSRHPAPHFAPNPEQGRCPHESLWVHFGDCTVFRVHGVSVTTLPDGGLIIVSISPPARSRIPTIDHRKRLWDRRSEIL